MKKTTMILGLCMALSGCIETDIDKAAEIRSEHLRADRMENGCQFTDDHAAYRNCIMNTYYRSKPKTYVSARDETGKSLAIIRNDSTSSYDEKTGAYKTERVIVIETEEKLVPVPTETVIITEEKQQEPVVVETVVEQTTPATQEVKTTEEVKTVEEVKVSDVKEEKTAAQPEKETWWDKYQKNHQGKKDDLKCPCEDPNDPCPQCVDK